MSGSVRLAAGIEAELARRLPRQRRTQRGKLALHRAVSTGMGGGRASAPARRTKAPEPRPEKLARGRGSFFTRGLRRSQRFLQLPLPPLWGVWQN